MALISAKKTKEPKFRQIINLEDDKINVLLLGTSGCGKTTLVNAVLGREQTVTAATKQITVCENDTLPFRMIDTVGFEYGFFRQNKIRKELADFCREGIRKAETEKLIHVIWLCVDAAGRRLDQAVLEYTRNAVNDWKNVPVIIVFTKSYSEQDIPENIQMAKEAVLQYNLSHKRNPLDVRAYIPVVAKPYPISDTVSVPPRGLDDLIRQTTELIPEAKQIAETSIKDIDVRMKRAMAYAAVCAASASAAAVGAVPIPFPDASVLVPIQTGMMMGISRIYDISDQSAANTIIDQIIKVGGTTIAGKTFLNQLKAVPGLNIASSVLNAVVAGVITFAAGEISSILFEKTYTGEIDARGVDWQKEITVLFSRYLPGILKVIKSLAESNDGKITVNQVINALKDLFRPKKS